MPELSNSSRQILKATHIQIRHDDSKKIGAELPARAIDKLQFMRQLNITPFESKELDAQRTFARKVSEPELIRLAVAASAHSRVGNAFSLAQALAPISTATIVKFAAELAKLRQKHDREVHTAVTGVLRSYRDRAPSMSSLTSRSGLNIFGLSHAERRQRRAASKETGRSLRRPHLDKVRLSVDPAAKEVTSHRLQVTPPTFAERAFAWAEQIEDPRLAYMAERGRSLSELRALVRTAGPALEFVLPDRGVRTVAITHDFEEKMHVEPVGRLHLERLTMTPAGIERGELLYSVPLAPAESVNISHKEWSTRSEEFEKIVQDTFEGYSETGVAEKTDLSQSTDSQQKHSRAFSLSGTFSYVGTATVKIGLNTTAEDQSAEKNSRKQSAELTSKASKRATSDHKNSFKVESAYGSEDQNVRRIVNPSSKNVTRLDYYQMMRKWRVDLYRSDVRLTYDIVIPRPGAELRLRLEDLRRIEQQLNQPFRFTLEPTSLTAENWEAEAARVGGRVGPPPPAEKPLPVTVPIPWRSEDAAEDPIEQIINLDVGDDYTIETASFEAWFGRHNASKLYLRITGEQVTFGVNDENIRDKAFSDLANIIGSSGDVTLLVTHREIAPGGMLVKLGLVLKPEVLDRWRYDTWRTLRDSAEEQYFQAKEALTLRRERLLTEIQDADALTLRQMEREAIMRGVLTWMLGPGFEFGPPADPTNPAEPLNPTDTTWMRVLEYGEFAKFIHHAIEWENVLFFLYPYFWDEPDPDHFTLFLNHPDGRHREFLRAGSARVVLTVRPGYEVEFTNLLETGYLNATPNAQAPYLSIAQELQNFAKANYPGIPPANPVDNYRTLLSQVQKSAWRDMQRLMMLLESVKETTGAYPPEASWLNDIAVPAAALEGSGEIDPWGNPWSVATLPQTDPWGKPWVYKQPGIYGEFDVATYGADGQPGGEGDDADITSWAEASLVGRWYEYTPTSALDITLDAPHDTLS